MLCDPKNAGTPQNLASALADTSSSFHSHAVARENSAACASRHHANSPESWTAYEIASLNRVGITIANNDICVRKLRIIIAILVAIPTRPKNTKLVTDREPVPRPSPYDKHCRPIACPFKRANLACLLGWPDQEYWHVWDSYAPYKFNDAKLPQSAIVNNFSSQ